MATEEEKRLHRCCFTGHRPEKLNASDEEVKRWLETQIDQAIAAVREANPAAACVVDNCYGEFTERREPAGDLLAGSLIKIPAAAWLRWGDT